jgi:hypothetical protein
VFGITEVNWCSASLIFYISACTLPEAFITTTNLTYMSSEVFMSLVTDSMQNRTCDNWQHFQDVINFLSIIGLQGDNISNSAIINLCVLQGF